MRSTRLALLAAGVGLTLVLSACGANEDTGGGGGGGEDTADQSSGGIPVGVILPETATSARWEGFDKPMLEAALKAEGLDPDIQNAQGDVQKFSTLADGMINDGVKVLIIAAINSEIGGTPRASRRSTTTVSTSAAARSTTSPSTTSRSASSRARAWRTR
jgi:D-xylose transport system substrate-binding protein